MESTEKERFCFRSDDSCHNYLIPIRLLPLWNKIWSAIEEFGEDAEGIPDFDATFGHFRCNDEGAWSFADPKEDV